MPAPAVSVVIPAWNEAKYLEILLDSLSKQTVKDFEVVVADSESNDGTEAVCARFGARFMPGPRLGAGEGRNRGAKAAQAELLVFIDSDCVAPATFIEEVEKIFSDPSIVAGACRFLPLDGKRIDYWFYRIANAYQEVAIKLGFPHNAGYAFAYRKGVYTEIGGINQEVTFNETHDLAIRTRGKGVFVYIEAPVYTSMRRYRQFGYFETVFMLYIRSLVYYYATKKSPEAMFTYKPAR